MRSSPRIPPWIRRLPEVLDPAPVHPWPRRVFRKQAGVLVLLGVHPSGATSLILTQRSPDLPVHAGQIAFPGGVCEPGESPLEAALRETLEEIALPPEEVRLLGPLGRTFSPYDIAVQPFVGWVPLPYPLHPNEEVARIFILPLRSVMRRRPRVVLWQVYGVVVPLFSYRVDPHTEIWGMTGRVLVDLVGRIRRVRASSPLQRR